MSRKDLTIAVASGKGGVGKSMFTSALAMLLSRDREIIAIDADVDAPNLHLWLGGIDDWDETKKVSLTEKAKVIKRDFNCQDFKVNCQFGAISCSDNQLKINPFLCEGCGLCQEILGPEIIKMEKVVNGEIKFKKSIFGFPLISGQLYPGQTGSGKIVDEIIEFKKELSFDIKLIDVPAGLGCPVTAALKSTDLVLLVTEPTPTGWSDLKRILSVVKNFNLDWRLVINKYDLDQQKTEVIINWAGKKYLGKISYDKDIFTALSQLKPIMGTDLKTKQEIEKMSWRLKKLTKIKCPKKLPV
jgi:MinD superfamily P-loop ATPase